MVKRVLKIFYKEFNSINEAALLLGMFTFFSQLLGIVRDRFLAANLGASLNLDIYYAAFRIPDFLFAIAASLVSVTILIPFFVEKLGLDSENPGRSRKFINNIFTAFFIMIIVVSGITFIIMPWLAQVVAPGFEGEALSELVRLSRIMLLSPILLGVSNLLGTITQAFRKFFVYALSPIFYNLGIIVGILAFYPIFGLSGLAWGVALGALLHVIIQLPVVIRQGYFPTFTWRINWREAGQIAAISLPRTLTLSLSKISIIVLIALASQLAEGSVSILNFAMNLQNVPLTIIGVSFSVAAFPTLVKLFSENNKEEFYRKLVMPARQIVFWSIPVIIFFVVLRAHIVRVILGAGEFSWADTRLTAAALALFVISVMFQSLILLLVRGYYAAGKTARPLLVNLFGTGATIGFAFWFLNLFNNNSNIQAFFENVLRVEGVPGTNVLMLALAYTIGVLINFALMWGLFKWEFMREYKTGLTRTFIQSLIASIVMGVVIYQLLRLFDNFLDINTFWGVFGQGVLSGLIGIAVAITLLVMMKNKEIDAFWRAMKNKKIWKTRLMGSDTENVS